MFIYILFSSVSILMRTKFGSKLRPKQSCEENLSSGWKSDSTSKAKQAMFSLLLSLSTRIGNVNEIDLVLGRTDMIFGVK